MPEFLFVPRWSVCLGFAVVFFALVGCDRSPGPQAAQGSASSQPGREAIATQRFDIGPPERYKDFGVYTDFRRSHGIYIVSTYSSSGTMIVALSALCTYADCGTRYDRSTNRFKCPCHGCSYDSNGLVSNRSLADRALERCRIDLVNGQLIVNPNTRYRQDRNQWSNPYSMHVIGSPEHEDQTEAGEGNRYRPHLTPRNPFMN